MAKEVALLVELPTLPGSAFLFSPDVSVSAVCTLKTEYRNPESPTKLREQLHPTKGMIMIRKTSFICPVCGQADGLPPSVLTMQGNYGSREHDTERATVNLCGSCFDRLYAVIRSNLPDRAIVTEFIL